MDTKKPLAIISGGAGYLGSAISNVFREHGWVVASLSRRTLDQSDVFECDITKEEDVQKAIGQITEKYGIIHSCVHAASAPMSTSRTLLSDSISSFDNQFAVSVKGAFFLAKASLPHMEKNSAFIGITTALIEPKARPFPSMGSYVTAKNALRGFLKVLAIETKPHAIRINAVAPGFMSGGLNAGTSEKVLQFLSDKTAVGTTTSSDIAQCVVKIASEIGYCPPHSSIVIPSGLISPL